MFAHARAHRFEDRAHETAQTLDKDHGRIETRTATVMGLSALAGCWDDVGSQWTGLQTQTRKIGAAWRGLPIAWSRGIRRPGLRICSFFFFVLSVRSGYSYRKPDRSASHLCLKEPGFDATRILSSSAQPAAHRSLCPCLNSLLVGSPRVMLTSALAINNLGQIVAESATDAYLLTPYGVPESGMLPTALLGLGLIVVGFDLCRRRPDRFTTVSLPSQHERESN